MYFTDLLNNIHQMQYQVGKARLNEAVGYLDGFYGDFPAVQIYSNADQLIVRAEVPGLSQDDVQLNISDDVLSISGETGISTAGDELKNYKLIRRERRAGKFQKTIELPSPVDAARSEAVLKNGILSITFPLKEEAKPRQISIKSE